MYKQAYYRGGAVMNKTKLQWEKLFSEDRERKTKLSYEIRNAFECEYSYAAEPPVQFRLSHLSRRSEPL